MVGGAPFPRYPASVQAELSVSVAADIRCKIDADCLIANQT